MLDSMKLAEKFKKNLLSRKLDLNTFTQVQNLSAQHVHKTVYFVDSNVQNIDLINPQINQLLLIALDHQKIDLFMRFDSLTDFNFMALAGEDSQINLNVLIEQESIDSKLDLELIACAKNANVNMNIVYDLTGKSVLDLRTKLSFEDANNTGEMKINGVLDGKSFGKSFAEIFISPKANLTDSQMRQEVLVLSDNCRNQLTPALEILTDDVKAAHGVSVSQVPDEVLFYFESRGVSKACAKKLYARALKEKLFSKKILCDNFKGIYFDL